MSIHSVHGHVTKKHVYETGKEAVFFELTFPADWKFLEQKLQSATQGFAHLNFELLNDAELDYLDKPVAERSDLAEPLRIGIIRP